MSAAATVCAAKAVKATPLEIQEARRMHMAKKPRNREQTEKNRAISIMAKTTRDS